MAQVLAVGYRWRELAGVTAVDDVTHALRWLGVPSDQIHAECFAFR